MNVFPEYCLSAGISGVFHVSVFNVNYSVGLALYYFYTVVIPVSSTYVFLSDMHCTLLFSKASSPLFAMGRSRNGSLDRRLARGLINVLFV